MNSESPFADIPAIGELPDSEIVELLRELGDVKTATEIEESAHIKTAVDKRFEIKGVFTTPEWKHTAHAFGYIGPAGSGQTMLPIKEVGQIDPDTTLSGGRINVTLDYLRVANYPGFGTHTVLFDFYAKNQLPKEVEPVHFNATYQVRDGQRAPVKCWPIFIGLNVKDQGLALNCVTVNVKSSGDESFLSFLNSDLFKNGLKLATTVQPAIAPFSAMAAAMTRRILGGKRNRKVQDFFLGLGLSQESVTGARLRTGSYISVQVPESDRLAWHWADWHFDRGSGQIVKSDGKGDLVPYNYLIFGISRFLE